MSLSKAKKFVYENFFGVKYTSHDLIIIDDIFKNLTYNH